MPRRPRVFVEGGLYHVYNRFVSGEGVFSDPEEAKAFVDLFRWVKRRDGWTVLAWCLMSNHYHFAIRSRAVPISHGLHCLQGRFSQRYNRNKGRTGALWQSRYQAKLINEGTYLGRVILYIHLNPVVAGFVSDPADHKWSGHRELAKRSRNPLIDFDDVLTGYHHVIHRHCVQIENSKQHALMASRHHCSMSAASQVALPLSARSASHASISFCRVVIACSSLL